MMPGLVRVATPALPGGSRVRCTMCGCHVAADHNPGDMFCLNLQSDRIHKEENR